MATCGSVNLTGRSGSSFSFTVFPLGTPFAAVGGVYAIMRHDGVRWLVYYIGQTGDLSVRFDCHHHEADFELCQATHIAVIGISSEVRRRQIETDLVSHYAPPINQTAHG